MMKGNGQKHDPNLPKQERSRTRWTLSQDKIFADLVVEQIQQGDRSNNMFDQKAWLNIQDKFNAQTGLNFNKKQLRKHLEVLRIRYDNLKSATEQSVFNLEESNRMILPDYGLWGDLMEEQPPKRETLKIKDCPIFYQLCLIFNDAGSDGKYAQSSHYEGMESNAIGLDSPYASSIPKSEVEHVTKVSKTPTMRNDTNTSNKRNKRSSETPDMQQMLTEAMAKALSDMVSASKIRVALTRETRDRFSISNCITALDEIQGIDQSLYFAALDLFDYPSYREIFMSLQRDQQIGWLQDKCGNASSSLLM